MVTRYINCEKCGKETEIKWFKTIKKYCSDLCRKNRNKK